MFKFKVIVLSQPTAFPEINVWVNCPVLVKVSPLRVYAPQLVTLTVENDGCLIIKQLFLNRY